MATLDDKTKQFLDEKRFAVVATINADGTPQQTVLWYMLNGDKIIMNTAVGRVKEKNLKRDLRISFCVEEGYQYVTLEGRAELDYDQERAHEDIQALAVRYQGEEAGRKMAENTFNKEERVTIRMTIEDVDARL